MSPRRPDATRHANARKCRDLKAQERLERDRRQAQQAAEACQIASEEAYYGNMVLRLMGGIVLFHTSMVICHGRMTMEV
jgi:hypothetical protein